MVRRDQPATYRSVPVEEAPDMPVQAEFVPIIAVDGARRQRGPPGIVVQRAVAQVGICEGKGVRGGLIIAHSTEHQRLLFGVPGPRWIPKWRHRQPGSGVDVGIRDQSDPFRPGRDLRRLPVEARAQKHPGAHGRG
jgi:hypothetical protein